MGKGKLDFYLTYSIKSVWFRPVAIDVPPDNSWNIWTVTLFLNNIENECFRM